MIELSINRKQLLAMAFVLFAVLLSSINSVNAAIMSLDMTFSAASQHSSDEHDSSHSSHCVETTSASHCESSPDQHDHAQCSELHCSSVSYPVSTALQDIFPPSSHVIMSVSSIYSSIPKASPYMPPIVAIK